ncbi:GIY-YIG nuclease family protein [uncultured Desulfovibrio sp.]|uniref:GIY-YIG nuclease family protein n=1 Tax=uncultured Desulfovibrio sp. TaxID=167968 RepID=UPI00262D0AD6|nr:GIY-YIG nuclease family protein [uncultured Desulfovibrio sp.]
MRWFVYLVRCADDSLYCGITTDVARRLAQHNGGLAGGARYTRSRRPVRLEGVRCCEDRSAALRLEARIKRAQRAQKPGLLAEEGEMAS